MRAGDESTTASEPECLVRYGLAGHVGWFALGSDLGPTPPERGETVVIRTRRGVELGELLSVAPEGRGRAGEDSLGAFRVLRTADADDVARARQADQLRGPRFDLCRGIVEEAGWPLELVDVEPLLDLGTVLHVLAADDLDPAPVRARFRVSCDFDVFVEALGAASLPESPEPPATPGRCGDCDCGGGGCSRKAARTRADAPEAPPKPSPSPCSTSTGAGCASCGVSAWKAKAKEKEKEKGAAGGGGSGGVGD